MDQRGYLQAWQDGRDDEIDFFSVTIEDNLVFGVEAKGIIYYVLPIQSGDEILVFITLESGWGKMMDALMDVSMPRFEILSEHCPNFCRAIMDGFSDDARYDRGAFARIGNAYVLIRQMAYDFSGIADSDNPLEAIASASIAIVVRKLIELHNEMIKEWEEFDGFSSWEEVKATAKEAFNGAKVGWKYGRLFSFFGLS